MNEKPERAHELGIATWFAPILSPLLSIALYLYQAKVNEQDIDAFYMVLFAVLGGIAGLLICVLAILPAKRKATKSAPNEIEIPSMAKPQDVKPGELRRAIGAGFVAVSIFLMFISRLGVAVFVPEFSDGGLTDDKTKVLLPVWTIGIIGIILWLWPSRSRDPGSKESRPDDTVH
jgi:MFS family permease